MKKRSITGIHLLGTYLLRDVSRINRRIRDKPSEKTYVAVVHVVVVMYGFLLRYRSQYERHYSKISGTDITRLINKKGPYLDLLTT